MLLGAHLSVLGGLHRALIAAHEYGFSTVSLFVRNQVQWHVPPLGDEQVEQFQAVREEFGIGPVIAHGSYLVNLAGEEPVRARSIAATRTDLERCRQLGIEYMVVHPGSHEDPAAGIARIAAALDEILCDPPAAFRRGHSADRPARPPLILLETTAGAGHAIGRTFEQLAEISSRIGRADRVGFCLDTCHIFAAGYDIRTPPAYEKTMADFDRTLGLRNLHVVHLNDSKRALGGRVDRHEHIGRGRIGRRGLACLINDPRLAAVPMILETPKGTDEKGRDWDAVNARAVRRLATRARR